MRIQKLLRHFGSAKKAWNASFEELKVSSIGAKISKDLIDFKKKFSLADYEETLQKIQVSYGTIQDEDYHELLKAIKNPHTILYKKGAYMFNKNDTLVSFVGTRKIT